jgi:hypothetical protein
MHLIRDLDLTPHHFHLMSSFLSTFFSANFLQYRSLLALFSFRLLIFPAFKSRSLFVPNNRGLWYNEARSLTHVL